MKKFIIILLLITISIYVLIDNSISEELPFNVKFILSLSNFLLKRGLFQNDNNTESDMLILRQRLSSFTSFVNMLTKGFLSGTTVSRTVMLDNQFQAKQQLFFPAGYDTNQPAGGKKYPIVMYIHSGGFCIGEETDNQLFLDRLSNKINAIVISIQYRLAPEFKSPTALNDVHAHLKYIYKNANEIHGDKHKILVAGESAGGNLAVALSMKLRDEKSNIALIGQYLSMPCLDPQTHAKGRDSSKKYGSHNFFLSNDLMNRFWILYSPNINEQNTHHYIDPINAKDLSNLPPVLLHVGQADVLHDESIEFASKLEHSGTSVVLEDYANVVHAGIISLGVSFPEQMNHALNSFHQFFLSLL